MAPWPGRLRPETGSSFALVIRCSVLPTTRLAGSYRARGGQAQPRLRKAYFNNYLDQYKDTVGPLMGKRGLQYVVTDSWEAGAEN